MRCTLLMAGFLLGVFVSSAGAYEWLSHNRKARVGAERAVEAVTDDPNEELKSFLSQCYGEDSEGKCRFCDFDTRASDAVEDGYTDEDHNEAECDAFMWCSFREKACWNAGSLLSKSMGALPCSFDHFFSSRRSPGKEEKAQ